MINRHILRLGLFITTIVVSLVVDPNAAAQDDDAGGKPLAIPYDRKFVQQIARDAMQDGDVERGAAVFASAKSACMSCHRVGHHGGTIGPDLTQISHQRKLDHVIESLFWPTREVDPRYIVWQIIMADGKVISGYRVGSSDDHLDVLELSSDQTVRIPRSEIDEELAGTTPMPEQLTAGMSRLQRLDLIRFLAELNSRERQVPAAVQTVFSRSHDPQEFDFDRAPLHSERWPNSTHAVNEHRVYDYYTKQAEFFRARRPLPMLIAPFPGLDGGVAGHWGFQTEDTWVDDRWNDAILGSVQSGVFYGAGAPIPRAVCIRLGDKGELSACFNPDTLTYDAVWSGGFVRFSSTRHGFMHGLKLDGRRERLARQDPPTQSFVYHGFYRHGRRVLFSYEIGGNQYLDAPWVTEDGQFTREVAKVELHSLRQLTDGGPVQWPQRLSSKIVPGTGRPYAVDTIGVPFDNPWNVPMFFGGHDFFHDGSALVCTIQGDVWHVTGLNSPPDQPATATWRRVASGLHHALGLVITEGEIYVQCRDQITRLHDRNGDGEADFYECFSNAFETSPAGHDFICGLQRDDEGNFYTASGNQGILKISSDGRSSSVIATGLRNPDGLGILPDGTVTAPCSEGEWTPASTLCAIRPTPATSSRVNDRVPHFGYRGPQQGRTPDLPLAYVPRGLDNSSGGQVYVDSNRWGPMQGQLLHLSFGMGSHFLVLRDEVDGQIQGAVVPLVGDFRSGVHRGRFNPFDGQLYVSGMHGWVSFTPDDGCFQRVRYTGDSVQVPIAFHVHQNGLRITFSQSIDKDVAEHVENHFAQCWNYRYGASYGSPEFSPAHSSVPGHDPLEIASCHVLDDGRTIFLEIPELQPVSQLHLRMHVNRDVANDDREGHDLFVTVHRMDQAFVDHPNIAARPKVIATHPMLRDLAMTAKRVPNRWRHPLKEARRIDVETGKNLTFKTRQFSVDANQPIMFTLVNPDVVPHNWALIRPGSLGRVGPLANRLISDPEAAARQYIPKSDDVLFYTDVVPPGKRFTIYFRAPSEPGLYPFLCTFPGHWMVMNGVMHVTAANAN